jgi:hypothetical protein
MKRRSRGGRNAKGPSMTGLSFDISFEVELLGWQSAISNQQSAISNQQSVVFYSAD